MGDLNKIIFSKNLSYYMSQNNIDRYKLCEDLGFKYSTVSEWLSGRKYPRIDKIELLATYFGIMKSDLIEEHETKISNALELRSTVVNDEKYVSFDSIENDSSSVNKLISQTINNENTTINGNQSNVVKTEKQDEMTEELVKAFKKLSFEDKISVMNIVIEKNKNKR